MPSRLNAARDISYSHSASSRGGQALIRLIENSTGRLGLIRRAEGYEKTVAEGRDFWSVMVDRYGLSLDIVNGSLSEVPSNGPIVLIANHPYGILDGLMMGYILSRTRNDFRVLAHRVFQKSQEINPVILPISFEETREATQLNLQTRKAALSYLGQGGAVGVFPGGTVSTGVKPFAHPMDPGWRSFTARMISKSRATVVPVFFEGHTSRLFQIVSHLNYTLRMGLLIKEFRRRVDTPVKVVIGEPIGRDILDPLSRDAKQMMDFLRKATYELSPIPLDPFQRGFEFEDRHRA